GRRRRLLWVLLPSLALHAPYVPTYLGHPETLLAVAGVPPAATTATTTDLLPPWPVAPGVQDALLPLAGATAAAPLPLLPRAPGPPRPARAPPAAWAGPARRWPRPGGPRRCGAGAPRGRPRPASSSAPPPPPGAAPPCSRGRWAPPRPSTPAPGARRATRER